MNSAAVGLDISSNIKGLKRVNYEAKSAQNGLWML